MAVKTPPEVSVEPTAPPLIDTPPEPPAWARSDVFLSADLYDSAPISRVIPLDGSYIRLNPYNAEAGFQPLLLIRHTETARTKQGYGSFTVTDGETAVLYEILNICCGIASCRIMDVQSL